MLKVLKMPAGSTCPVGEEMGGFNFVLDLRAMSEMALVLGKPTDASRYASLAEVATASFHSAFWSPQFHAYGGDYGAIQTLTLPALAIGAPPAALLDTVVQTLADDIAQRTEFTPAVGAVTSKILLNVLSDHGLHETALRVATTTTEPSWGYLLRQYMSMCNLDPPFAPDSGPMLVY